MTEFMDMDNKEQQFDEDVERIIELLEEWKREHNHG